MYDLAHNTKPLFFFQNTAQGTHTYTADCSAILQLNECKTTDNQY